jgi:FeS assembly protein IscX
VKWTDTLDIAIALADAHPGKDPKAVNFVDLYKWVMALIRSAVVKKSSKRSKRRGSRKRNR